MVLGPEVPRFWVEILSSRILNILEDGLLVEFADRSLLLKNVPQHRSMLPGSTIAGWFRITGEEYSYTTVYEAKRRALVADYGEPVTREEAADAILRLAGEWEARADSLKRQADGIKDAETRARDERVRKFREEQEARRRREELLVPGSPNP